MDEPKDRNYSTPESKDAEPTPGSFPWDGRPRPPQDVVEADEKLSAALAYLREGKPGDRSEFDRLYAVVITEIQKTQAILRSFLM